MKEYNRGKWYINADIIPEMVISADDLKTAIEEYREKTNEKYYVSISKNAIKNAAPMFIDTEKGAIQTGLVITGKTDFEDDNRRALVTQYIDLWVEISVLQNAFENIA
jgi:hypothetical protein